MNRLVNFNCIVPKSKTGFLFLIIILTVGLFVLTQPVVAEEVVVSTVHDLIMTSGQGLKDNSTVLIKDGVYELPAGIQISRDHITYKSLSGKRDAVVLKGKGYGGNVAEIFSIMGNHVHIQDLTLGEVSHHGIQIHGENNAGYVSISNVRFYNIREQMLKGSYDKNRPDSHADNGLVENCLFEFPAGNAYQSYTAGIDIHHGENWVVKNSTFQNIKASGGGLTEGAIHFWTDSKNVTVEGNKIINCDRGILFGLDNVSHYGGLIKNNFIHTILDTGIYLCNAVDVNVYNNTVFIDSPYRYAIEYRFPKSKNISIVNNLTNREILARDNAQAFVKDNVTNAKKEWFVNASQGDLHLSQRIDSIKGKGQYLPQVTSDIDGEKREKEAIDIGADQNDKASYKKISRLMLTSDKNEIIADGISNVRLKVVAEYSDQSRVEVEPDLFDCVPSRWNFQAIKGDLFSVNTPGDYTILAKVGGVTSNSIQISVKGFLDRQVAGISVWHRDGQTFVTFDEILKVMPNSSILYGEYFKRKKLLKHSIMYNIYRSSNQIESVRGMKPIAQVDNFSGWNEVFWGISPSDHRLEVERVPRYVVKDGEKPLEMGKGVYVSNPSQPGKSYYAITAVIDGHENSSMTIGENSTKDPVEEIVGQGRPILQKIEAPNEFEYVQNPKLYFYVRWESPPNASVQGKPFDYLVGIPQNLKAPAPVGIHMHNWGGTLVGGYAWWNDAEKGAILLASNEIPYDWWTGYHEKIFTKNPPTTEKDWKEGVVHPYTINRLLSFVKFLHEKSQWKIDEKRIFAAGSSMGGSGSLMMAIRYPDKIAWARSWVGVHVPEHSPQFESSFRLVWGQPSYGVRFENGEPVWDYFNNAKYLLSHPKEEIGFLTLSNGKNDGEIGWKQAVEFVTALQQTKRPFLFIWGQEGHSQRTLMPETGSERVMPIDITVNTSLPAFTKCSLDNVLGNGDPKDGDPAGQINRWLYWETKDAVDVQDRWEMTVGLMNTGPKNECRVDITPRRVQQFRPPPGQKVKWENRTLSGKLISQGETVVDSIGLITVEQATVLKEKNRIIITRK